MRFKKGDKVEVMNSKEVPLYWRIGEIVSGSGHTYCVYYNSYSSLADNQMVEKVPRKFVRPHPPVAQGLENCSSGDIVEVFHRSSWKPAAILKIMDKKEGNIKNKILLHEQVSQKQYFVRLLGSSRELVVCRGSIRIRQAWHDGKWILMGKSSQAGNDVVASKCSKSNYCRKMAQLNTRVECQPKQSYKDIQDDAAFMESTLASSRSLKRMSPYCSTIVEAQNGCLQKLRAVEEEGQKQRVAAVPGHKEVHVVYPKDILGEKNMHASHNNIMANGYNQMERKNPNDVPGYYLVRSTELNHSDSDASSVGSCSISKQSPKNSSGHFRPTYYREKYSSSSDAESSCVPVANRESSSLPPKQGFEVSIRRLELHAYRSTLEALYASGPLSWDQEALLTNLRIMLHISNDEHLQELRQLVSSKTAIGVR